MVYIKNDLTKTEKEIQSKIINIAKDEIGRSRRIKLGYIKLITNGKKWTWDMRKEELVEAISTGANKDNSKN